MKKSIKLVSFLAIISLLSCTGEIIKQNVTINNDIKPTSSSSISKLPIEVKPSPIESPSPKIEGKKYTSAIFVLKSKRDNMEFYREDIVESPIFNDIEEEKKYSDTLYRTKNSYFFEDSLYLNKDGKSIYFEIIYPDGTIDTDYNIEIPEKFKEYTEVKDNIFFKLKDNTYESYIKVSSKRNKQLFKFFDLKDESREYSLPFYGKVLDPLGNPVEGAKVKVKALDPGINWETDNKLIENSFYIFRKSPIGARILITVTKDGWTSRQRTDVIKSNVGYDANRFDFDGIYALQDEPEINSLKVNGKSATANGSSQKPDIENLPNALANLKGLDNINLEIEITFSEPVITSDIENYFKVTSQDFGDKKNNHITIDKNTEGLKFEWSENNQKLKISLDKPLIENYSGNEAKYLLEFTKPFRDLTNKESKKGKYIRYNPANTGDFHVFSIKNSGLETKLLSITAHDREDNDIIELNFNNNFNYWWRKAYILALEANKNKRVYKTNNINGNASTILGYSKGQESLKLNDFVAIYSIGKILKNSDSTVKLIPLDINNMINGSLINGNSIISAKIVDNIVKLELPSTAFNKGEQIVLSLGSKITGNYENNNNKFSIDTNLIGIENEIITELIGNLMSKGTSSLENNVTINDLQKTTIVE